MTMRDTREPVTTDCADRTSMSLRRRRGLLTAAQRNACPVCTGTRFVRRPAPSSTHTFVTVCAQCDTPCPTGNTSNDVSAQYLMTCEERKSTPLSGYCAPAAGTTTRRHKRRYARGNGRKSEAGAGSSAHDGYLRRFRKAARNVVWAYGEERDSALSSLTVAIAELFVKLHMRSGPSGARRVPKYAEEWAIVFIYIALWRLRRAEPVMAITSRVLGAQRNGFRQNRDWADVAGSVTRRLRKAMKTLVPPTDISPSGLPWAALIVPDMVRSITDTLRVKKYCALLCVTCARTASAMLDTSIVTVTSDTRKNAGAWAASVVYTVLTALGDLSRNAALDESPRRKRRPTTDRYNTAVRKAVAATVACHPGRLNGHMFPVKRTQTFALAEAGEMPSCPRTNPLLDPPQGILVHMPSGPSYTTPPPCALVPTHAPPTPIA